TRMTLSMAVSHAGSYTKFASTGSIQILRHLPSGGTRTLIADLDAILEGKGADPEILPGDVEDFGIRALALQDRVEVGDQRPRPARRQVAEDLDRPRRSELRVASGMRHRHRQRHPG